MCIRDSIPAFDNKYPPGPLDGWHTTNEQIFEGQSVEYLKSLRDQSEGTKEVEGKSGLWEFVPPDPRSYYIILCDPANFGSHGDYSAIAVFDTATWEEVACWEGFEQPTDFNLRLKKAARSYTQVGSRAGYTLIPENNAGALMGVIENEAVLNLYWSEHNSGRKEPGWRATARSLQVAEAAMDKALKSGDIRLHSPTGIQQLITFDGKARERRIRKGKNTSHFELARTYVMAAWALRDLRWPHRLTDEQCRDRLEQAKATLMRASSARDEQRRRAFESELRKRRNPQPSLSQCDVWAPFAGMSR